jgi:hypothetical protein
VDLCIAIKAAQGASIEAFLAHPHKPTAPRLTRSQP